MSEQPQPRSASQADFTFKLAESQAEWEVIAFDGREGLSIPFDFQIDLSTEADSVEVATTLGKGALLEISTENGSRFVHGMVRRFERTGQGGKRTHYAAEIAPLHWLLSKRVHARIFQQHNCSDMSYKGIIAKVLTDAGLPDTSFRFALEANYPTHEYIVQYRESDLDFITRLMEECGMHYFFEHAVDGHKMVIADGGVAHVTSKLADLCKYRATAGLEHSDEIIYALRETADIQSDVVHLTDFNFTQPGTDLLASKEGQTRPDLTVFDFPGRYQVRNDGANLAGIRQEAFAARKRVLQLAGNIRGLLPGEKFTLSEHPVTGLNAEYLVTQVMQRGTQPQGADGIGSGATPGYEADYQVMPASVPYRSMPLTPRPKIVGSQTALVTGPSGEEIYTDEYGRVKVKFHWDLEGKHDENSSRWIRVSQGMAGGQYGMLFLPRVGQEVVVDFLEGDPDRPIITGRVYNNDHRPPYNLPDEKTKSVIKTHTSKGGGGTNEVCFEDKQGEEKIMIYAQKDMHVRTVNDHVTTVNNDQHVTVIKNQHQLVKEKQHSEVVLDRSEKVGGKYSLEVTGDQGTKVGGNVSIDAAGKIYFKSGSELVLEAASGLTLKVGGNFVKIDSAGVTIVGTLTKINSGGAAGSGQAVALNQPEEAAVADSATAGQDTTYTATPQDVAAGTPQMDSFNAVELPEEEEVVQSWVEIEMVDEEGQPYPNERYEITLPDGKVRKGRLDKNGLARVLLPESAEVQVTFPDLDTDAWERI